jgi:NADH-quinone oxidoreductase subunit N
MSIVAQVEGEVLPEGAVDGLSGGAVDGVATTLTEKILMPAVDWTAIAPSTILVTGALVLLVLASLFRHSKWISGTYVWVTLGTVAAAAFSAWRQWIRIRPGSFTALADAVKIDGFAVFITVSICCALALAALVVDGYLKREQLEGPEVFVLMMLSAAGGIIMASSNDLIVLFLGLEILSIALYVLAGSHLRRAESQEAALKYFVLGGFSSALFLYGIALTYGATGSTNLGKIGSYLSENVVLKNGLLTAGLALLLVGMAFKVAAVPFHLWTPDVYQGSPSPVAGFMAAAAKAAGFAALLRVLLTALGTLESDWRPIVWVLAIITMVIGSILTIVQTDVKRTLAYSSISHAGFIMIGLHAASTKGVSASLFYVLTYTFVVLGTFAVVTIIGRRGDAAHSLSSYEGLGKKAPVLALALTLFLLGQAGIPMTSGFVAKFGVLSAAVDVKSYAIAIVAMLASVISGFAYLRVIVKMYFAGDGEETPADAYAVPVGTKIAIAIAAAFTLFAGVAPQALLTFAEKAILR